jgi:chromosomal replication initiator protein
MLSSDAPEPYTPAMLAALWQTVSHQLKAELGETPWRAWLSGLIPIALQQGTLQLAVGSHMVRDWVRKEYAERLLLAWRRALLEVERIDIIVAAQAPAPAVTPFTPAEKLQSDHSAAAQPPIALLPPIEMGENQDSRGLEERFGGAVGLDVRFTFENFVLGKPNEFAYNVARKVADATQVTFNPLFLYGGVGLGKTHLMHAIAWHILKTYPERRVIYLSAEKFMNEFIRALRFKDTIAFKEQFRSVDVLMIDDVQFLGGKDSTQEELFHTFNALVDQKRQVVVTADKSPSDLELEERLRSRLGWGLVADIHPTNYELRLGILEAKATSLNVSVPHKVLEFLAHKITSNVRELEGALNRLAVHSEFMGRPATVDIAQEVLRDLLRANDRRVSIEDVQRKVAEHFSVRTADMHSGRRARAVARPRQVAMYLAKQLTNHSLPEIGRKFGGRDHTTVMHAVRKIEELMGQDASLAEDVALLRRMLQG